MDENSKKTMQTGLEIAVIGMAGRFPGARDIGEFRENLEKGVESVTFYTEEELKTAGVGPELLTNPAYIRSGGGVLQDADCFDASFFEYLPGEAEIMDPQTRIFHECAWEALEDAGYNPNSYNGTIGVYAGASNNPAWEIAVQLSGKNKAVGEFNSGTLANKEYLCLYVSYKLNLKGPAVEINTTCSTSLVAVHTACRALWTKECDIALAGGVSVRTSQKTGYLYREGMIMSPDGHCRAFDAGAGGTIAGSGAGVVVLKKLKEAAAHGDQIYAVIKGTAINNDGLRKVGFTAPSIEGQSDVIKTALHISRVDPETIGYIEAHGTGTAIGDPIEIEALTLAFNTTKRNYCAVGSVKTNVGHLDAAAGIAGLIKTVLALKHRRIPPGLHFKTPNPKIDFENSPFYVNTELIQWKSIGGFPLRAGVSSFGIGGTNAHAVLEEWPESRTPDAARKRYLLPLSAETETALEQVTENLAAFLNKHPGLNPADIAYTLAVGREAFQCKKTVLCTGMEDIPGALASSDPDTVQALTTREKKRPVIFMFPGQGAQYVNMGMDLYDTEPLFREEIDACFEILSAFEGEYRSDRTNKTYRTYMTEVTQSGAGELTRTRAAQPVIFAFEYALARLLMHWGIIPYAMIGHSIGEYTAACLSGVFSLADALRLTVLRGRLMQSMPPGTMLSVSLPEDRLKPLIPPGISLAAVNSTSLSVVSGPHDAVEKFDSRLKEMGFSTRRLHTSHAFHSAMMDPILPEFEETVKKMTLDKPSIPFISGVTGHWISNEKAVSPSYWAGHLRDTVNFRDGLSRLLETRNALFIEVGPGNVLSAFLRQHKDKTANHSAVNIIRHPHENIPDDSYLLSKIGQLWLHGVSIDWTAFYSGEKRYRVSLPTYPFERRRFLFNTDVLLNRVNGGTGPYETISAGISGETSPVEEDTVSYSRPELTRPYAAPVTPVQRKLVDLWQDFFGIRPIGIDDDFFELGGDSLKATTIIGRLHQELDVVVPLAEIFNRATVRELSEFVGKIAKTGFAAIEAAEKREYYTLSSAQKRLYILHRLEGKNTAYNLPNILSLEGIPDKDILEQTFKKLIARHESLRTSFEVINEEPVQRVHDEVDFKIEYFDSRNTGQHPDVRLFIRPFDLDEAPLMRVGLIEEESKNILIIDMHHIITDGTSQAVSVRDFMAFYSGEELPPLRVQYRDYSQWQQLPGVQRTFAGQEEYWRKEFEEYPPFLNLPADFPRPAVQRFEGNTLRFNLNREETGALKELAHSGEVTLFMMIFSIYNVFLAKVCGTEDIVIGTPTVGRRHADLEKLVGVFVNTVAMRSFPAGEKTFEQFMAEVKEKTIKAFENQDYPFEDLVEKLSVQRDMSRNPLFDTMFVLENLVEISGVGGTAHEKTGELKIKSYPYENRTSQFDLTLTAAEQDHELHFSMEYNTALFTEQTIARFVRYFKNIVSSVIGGPGKKISEIKIIPEEEKNRLLFVFNNTESAYPENKTIPQLFMEQAERNPDRIAAVGPSTAAGRSSGAFRQITYRELDNLTAHLGNVLTGKGACADNIIGIIIHRSLEMLVGLLGIWKSGSAYLPIDPGYPGERIHYILKDSSIKILLSEAVTINGYEGEIVQIPAVLQPPPPACGPRLSVNPSDPAYIIYTSGSTGKPKGVLVPHRAVVNRMSWLTKEYNLSGDDVIFQVTVYTFDVSACEFSRWIMPGARLCIPPPGLEKEPLTLLSFMLRFGVTVIDFVTSMLKVLLESIDEESSLRVFRRLRWVFVGAEIVSAQLAAEFQHKIGRFGPARLVNAYGPTETTVDVTQYICPVQDLPAVIPIGKPIPNTRIFILDKYDCLQPVGVPGELCVGGVCLAKGYLNNPELTAEKFYWSDRSYGSSRTYTLYRTGDLARWLPDGNLEFLGRIDHQVKVRGYRIELGEIENRVLNSGDIDRAVVIDKTNSAGEKYLCAYFTSKTKTDIPRLKNVLAGFLPLYMIPSHFIQVDEIPLTPGGKTDRKTLESLGVPGRTDVDHIPPRNEIERKIADAWKDVLEVETVGVNDNFFDLGGTSLNIIRLSAKFKVIFNEEETVVQMFRYPTIRSFAEYLSREKGETADGDGIVPPVSVDKIKQSRRNQRIKRIPGGISND